MFFDDHPEFLDTSDTANSKGRLNLRHVAIIEEHREVLNGARVLDIASHDGRWSFAALQAGAAHVTGIEGREHLVTNANKTFADKGIDPSQFRFIHGDAHDTLTAGVGTFDLVMCLGFLYHTLRYPELFAGIRATGARHVLIDTRVFPTSKRVVRLINNPQEIESMAIEDRFSYQGKTLVGTPSVSAVKHMLDTYGFDVVSRPDWAKIKQAHPQIRRAKQYERGERVTMLAVAKD